MSKKLLIALVVLAAIGGVAFVLTQDKPSPPMQPEQQNTQLPDETEPEDPPAFDKTQYSLSDPNSIWVVVNKKRPLNPIDYQPDDLVAPNVPLRVPGNNTMRLREVAAEATEKMFAAAEDDDISLMLASAHRSYEYQKGLYDGYVESSGQAAADTFSARPGYSEHQTGLAVDVEPVDRQCELEQCFGGLPEGQWVAANSYKFGFIIRYTKDNQDVAGYTYEPWHLRYVGVELATEMFNRQVDSLETFFNLSSAPDYK